MKKLYAIAFAAMTILAACTSNRSDDATMVNATPGETSEMVQTTTMPEGEPVEEEVDAATSDSMTSNEDPKESATEKKTIEKKAPEATSDEAE